VRQRIWEQCLSQRLIDKKGWAMLISTPHGQGWFYDLYRSGRGKDPTTKSWNFPSWENPILDRAVIEKERERLPERVFRQEYGAEFQAGDGAVFRNVRECATGTFESFHPGRRYRAGLDLAKHSDYTVLVILDRSGKVVFVDRYNRIDWGQQIIRVTEALRSYHFPECYVDSTGAGEPIYEKLLEAGLDVQPYQFTTSSKSALINGLVLAFETGKITLPRPDLWPEGIEELEAFEYSITDNGHTRTGAPSGHHDDCVIALALAYYGVSQPSNELTITSL
jgi:phage FluMu gp28-like protein